MTIYLGCCGPILFTLPAQLTAVPIVKQSRLAHQLSVARGIDPYSLCAQPEQDIDGRLTAESVGCFPIALATLTDCTIDGTMSVGEQRADPACRLLSFRIRP